MVAYILGNWKTRNIMVKTRWENHANMFIFVKLSFAHSTKKSYNKLDGAQCSKSVALKL